MEQIFKLESYRTIEKDSKIVLEFEIRNTTSSKTYEFVKLYIGTNYVGLKYLDTKPEEVKTVRFKVDTSSVLSNPEVYLTSQDKEQGVLLKQRYEQFKEQEGSEIEEKPERWDELEEEFQEYEEEEHFPERLEKEYEDLKKRYEGQELESVLEKEEKETKKSFIKSVVDSFKSGKSEKDEEEEEESREEEKDQEETGEGAEEGEEEEEERQEPLPSETVERTTTGIINLDQHMQGGLVQGTMNLVTGKTGTGKTAFCASFLKGGADQNEAGIYVTTEEREEDIKADIKAMFGWEFEDLEEQGLVKILSIKPIFPSKEIQNLNRLVRSYISNLLDQVMHAVEEIEAERVIIDSVSIIEMFIRDEYMSRVALASLLNKLREADVTALLTGTVPETSEGLSGGGIIEFLVDTVILLEFVPVAEDHQRTLTIRKMRRTDHDVAIFPMDITPDGMKVFEVQ